MSISKGCIKLENQLIAALPTSEYQRLIPHLERVTLPLQQVLYEECEPITHVYFPLQGIVSLVSTMEDGGTVEVGMVGNEGIVGMPVLWGGISTITRAFVQIPGFGMKIKGSLLKTEFDRGGALQTLLLRYTQALHTQVSQGAACFRLHTIEQRLARWLLTVHDRMDRDEFPLTQEFIAQMLGTRRAGVTLAANSLSQAGMIRYTRGRITILNRKELEATSCECYKTIQAEFTRLLGNCERSH